MTLPVRIKALARRTRPMPTFDLCRRASAGPQILELSSSVLSFGFASTDNRTKLAPSTKEAMCPARRSAGDSEGAICCGVGEVSIIGKTVQTGARRLQVALRAHAGQSARRLRRLP